MTAAGLDFVSGGRFVLGIGASGPPAVEGFHGVRHDAPLQRTREIVSIRRQVWRREPLTHRGEHCSIPLTQADGGSGLGKPLELIAQPVRESTPIPIASIAALGLKNVALAAEIADGWQPLFVHPGKFSLACGEALEAGVSKRDKSLGPLDLQVQVKFRLGLSFDGFVEHLNAGCCTSSAPRPTRPGWTVSTTRTEAPTVAPSGRQKSRGYAG